MVQQQLQTNVYKCTLIIQFQASTTDKMSVKHSFWKQKNYSQWTAM